MRGPYGRKDRLIKEKRHDAYKERAKWPEPTCCTECRALFSNGRWSWGRSLKKTDETVCPACQRIKDRYPAGYVELKGAFFDEHRAEILNLIHNIAIQEQREHPLERIMSITKEVEHRLVTTTGIHLARRIGQALSRAYSGELSFHYPDGEHRIRVCWQR